MKQVLLFTAGLFFFFHCAAQSTINWEWMVDTNIVYNDIEYKNGFIYGVGQEGSNGIIARKDTNGVTNWSNSIAGITFNQLAVSVQNDVLGFGRFSGSIVVNGNSYTSNGGEDLIIVRCDSNGVINLVKQFGSSDNDVNNDICVDNQQGIYIAAFCYQSIQQSGNTYTGNVISKFDGNGNPVFLHNVIPVTGPTYCSLVSLKYSSTDSSINIIGNTSVSTSSYYITWNISYRTGIDSLTLGNICLTSCDNIFVVKLTKSGFPFGLMNLTHTGNRTYYTTDLTITDNGQSCYTQRYQYSLNGYTYNSWESIQDGTLAELNSNGNWGTIDPCGIAYHGGHPLKIDNDQNNLYGTFYQPELHCGTYNCSDYYALHTKFNTSFYEYYALNIIPTAVTGHGNNFFLGSSSGGLYKSCYGPCSTTFPLTVIPMNDTSMCPGSSMNLTHPPCFNVYGGTAPYSYSWQPSTGLNNSTIYNPTVSGLPSGIYQYTLTVTDQNNNTAYDTVQVEVLAQPPLTYSMVPSPVSCGDSVTITASGANTYVYSWYDNFNTYHYQNTSTLAFVPTYNTTFNIIGTDSNNCKDTVLVPLNLQSSYNYTNASVCQSQLPYLWNGQNLTTPGMHTITFTNSTGCDSVLQLYLTIYPADLTYDSATVCYNQLPYNWNGQNLYAAGVYTDTLVGTVPSLGCDSIVTFKLKLEPSIVSFTATPATICQQDSSHLQLLTTPPNYCIPTAPYFFSCISNFQFHTINHSISSSTCGVYQYIQQNANVVVGSSYALSITSSTYDNRRVWIDLNRDGDFDDINELVFTSNSSNNTITGNIMIPANAKNGKTRLRVCALYNGAGTTCSHNSYGVYEDYDITISGGINTVTWSPATGLNTTVGPSVMASPPTTTTYTATVYSPSGCVQDTTITVYVNPTNNTMLSVSTCSTQLPYVWNGQNITTPGLHTITYTNASGCDSIEQLNLTIYATDITHDSVTICNNQLPYNWNGQNLYAAGVYTDTLVGIEPPLGCDSIVIFDLKVEPNISSLTSTPATICEQDSSYLQLLTVPPNYCVPTAPYFQSCIANFQFHTINHTNSSSVCGVNAYSYFQQNTNVVVGNTYSLSITSSNLYNYRKIWIDLNHDGDFDDTNELVFSGLTGTFTLTGTATIPSNAINGKTRLRVCASNVGSSTPCSNSSNTIFEDYDITISGGVNNVFWSPATGLNSTVGSSVMASPSTTTTYTATVYSPSGCVQDTTITVFVTPSDTTMLTVSTCTNQLPYVWYGTNINTSGTYFNSLTNSSGCDSVLQLDLTVNPSQTVMNTIQICSSAIPYLWNGINITSSGTYSANFTNQFGCDSVAQLQVSIYPLILPVISFNGFNLLTSSNYLSYQWYLNSNPITGATDSTLLPLQNGNYSVVVTDSNGCSYTSNLYNFMATGSFSNTTSNNFQVIPNPAHDQTRIVFSQLFDGSIQLINSHGQLMYEQSVHHSKMETIPLQSFFPGVYMIRIRGGEWTATTKLMIK